MLHILRPSLERYCFLKMQEAYCLRRNLDSLIFIRKLKSKQTCCSILRRSATKIIHQLKTEMNHLQLLSPD